MKILRIRSIFSFNQRSFNSLGSDIIDKINIDQLRKNIELRLRDNNLPKIKSLIEIFKNTNDPSVIGNLMLELRKLPNMTHPQLEKYGQLPKLLSCNSTKEDLTLKIGEENIFFKKAVRMEHLSNFAGHKSYYLKGNFAVLEQALIKYVFAKLRMHHFKIISVPDILDQHTIEGCGMSTEGERNQIYAINNYKFLSGTSEMALAGLHANKLIEKKKLPIKVASVSRCFRAETSGLQEERGIYRVHQFTKVEMFGLCTEKKSENLLEEFKNLQFEMFKGLNLIFRLLDMPPNELGSSAYRKYDIETWMNERNTWGEISSCSNCTDYQAVRLNIKYNHEKNFPKQFIHTINGTAAAIPRLLISIENTKNVESKLEVLQYYCCKGKMKATKLCVPNIKLIKTLRKRF